MTTAPPGEAHLWIGAGFQPVASGDDAALASALAVVDPPIRDLVAALSRSGWVTTVFSCAGHPEEPHSIRRGRRQAHLDVLVRDGERWRRFGGALRRAVRRAGCSARVVEGGLGAPPFWLEPHVPDLPHHEYRRLVLEPVPYDAPPAACRAALDAALGIALAALEEFEA